ncbi:MAG TPA: glycosyltransferase family 4 protein [Thermoanaerobaculia bacterium]|nr:glycosyltransferase family 4 protein [Thermoanaerobaculia bacterium]
MRILLLATDAYGGHGGIALFNRELCAALREHEVTVVPRVIRDEVRDVPPHVRFVAEAARGKLAYLREVTRLRFERFDLVICGHINLLPVAWNEPVLVVHGIEAWQSRRRSLAKCRGVISVSALTRDRLLAWSHYDGPVHVLPNAVHLERYGIRPRRRDLVERFGLEKKRVLLTVGRLDARERSKGFDEVMDVLPQLPDDVVYMIAGGGDDFPRLQAKAVALGLGTRVVFTGLFSEDDKPDLYNLADVYVMPSRGEGFGFVFLEAMACGVPVIGSSIDGGREALLGGALGTLVDPADGDAIRDAILAALAKGERTIPAGLEYFAFERFAERVSAIVTALRGESTRGRAADSPSTPER